MGCNSEYMNPSRAEANSKRVCELLSFLSSKTGADAPQWVNDAAKGTYGDPKRLDEATRMLCQMCRDVDDSVIYNAHDPMCRNLADWWEEHQAADRAREKAEAEARNKKLLELAEEIDSHVFSDSELASVGLKRIEKE